MTCRYAFAALFLLAALAAGCRGLGKDWLENARRVAQDMKADMAVLDSDDDGLDAFAPSDAKHLRAARAEMGR
jgi:hypothetical protein